MQKSTTTVISSCTIAAGETTVLADCTASDLSRVTELIFTANATFNAAATEGLTVYFYTSIDNSTYDTGFWDYWDIENYRQVGYASGTDMFVIGETLTAAAAGTGTVVGWSLSSGTFAGNDAAGNVYLANLTGTFTDTQALTGGTNGAATQDGSVAAHAATVTYYPSCCAPMYIKALIANDDTSQSATSVSLIATERSI